MKIVRGEKKASNMLANFDFGNYEINVYISLKRLGKKELEAIEIDCQYGKNKDSWIKEIEKKISENGFRPLWIYDCRDCSG